MEQEWLVFSPLFEITYFPAILMLVKSVLDHVSHLVEVLPAFYSINK